MKDKEKLIIEIKKYINNIIDEKLKDVKQTNNNEEQNKDNNIVKYDFKKLKINYKAIQIKRIILGYSMKDVAEATDINLRTYQRIENGESSPKAINIFKILIFLNMSIKDVLINDDKGEK